MMTGSGEPSVMSVPAAMTAAPTDTTIPRPARSASRPATVELREPSR